MTEILEFAQTVIVRDRTIASLLNVPLTDDKDENETLLAAAVQNLMGE